MKITLSACNMLQSIWRHSGNNSMPGESFLFPGRSSNTNALTAAQHSPDANASDHWAPPADPRTNGDVVTDHWPPWGDPFVFLVPYYQSQSATDTFTYVSYIERVSCISCLAVLVYLKVWQSEFRPTYYSCGVCPMSLPQNPVPANDYPTESHT
jgi:hypothetical protein